MKKIVLGVMLIVMVIATSYMQNFYTLKDCTVYQINDGYASVEDFCGWAYDFKANDLKVGDVVELKMHNNYTERYINDDIVKEYKKVR